VEQKKVLIITYYWPPSGGSGVQRWLKFVKYLPQYGIIPYVFTPENPSFDVKDPSLEKDVPDEAEILRFPIWEPYEAFFKLSGWLAGGTKKKATPTQLVAGKKKSWFQSAATWVRGNLIIPDPRVFWVRPSVRFLTDFIADNKIKSIITTGPPHSIHLIGLGLKNKNPTLNWIADFRDPWSEWGFLDSLMVGRFARARHRKLEQKVLQAANTIVTITPFYVRRFEQLSGRRVELLTNGFDEDDFKNVAIQKTEKFIIRHVGIVNEKCNPRPFMHALKEVMETYPEIKNNIQVDFVGEVHPDFKKFVFDDEMLKTVTIFSAPVPHKELIKLYNTSSVLLLVLTGYKDAEGYLPGKLFEYIATGLPVLGIGPVNGDAATLMQSAGVGEMVEAPGKIIEKLLACFQRWKAGLVQTADSQRFKIYSRRAITGKLAAMLEANQSSQ
jgi:glycosyltransferase involved in cell wall biosynthesis